MDANLIARVSAIIAAHPAFNERLTGAADELAREVMLALAVEELDKHTLLGNPSDFD